jgi:hypothetical protein
VVGRADLVEAVGARLAAPGISTDAGQVSGETLRILFQVRAPAHSTGSCPVPPCTAQCCALQCCAGSSSTFEAEALSAVWGCCARVAGVRCGTPVQEQRRRCPAGAVVSALVWHVCDAACSALASHPPCTAACNGCGGAGGRHTMDLPSVHLLGPLCLCPPPDRNWGEAWLGAGPAAAASGITLGGADTPAHRSFHNMAQIDNMSTCLNCALAVDCDTQHSVRINLWHVDVCCTGAWLCERVTWGCDIGM